ncbi:MAG: ExeA family protein, partial [Thermodesulfobacteriota bacterium]
MYNHFFGFKERPFKLVPNPDYLYMSRAHEEALAHLKYAAAEGDGFVEIIGEVGTGKTLLCRAFLESLGPDTETAYIFNPKMNAVGLLQTINTEFGIAADQESPRALIDALNAFLIEKKKAGQKVILLIDEAQNLGADVLEQLRLLSNLETSRDKLLQIILVGQPELGEMLDSHELRQLGQRIALSCRLRPLTHAETRAYVAHRLRVAARGPAVYFTRAAVRRIYKYSGGIARLINIACDRALLVAYGMGRKKITGAVARMAVSELASRGQRRRRATWPAGAVLTGALVAAVIAGIGLYQTGNIPIAAIGDRLSVDAPMADNKDKAPAEQPAADKSADAAPAFAPAGKSAEKSPKPADTAQKTAKKTKDGQTQPPPPLQAPASPAEAIGLKKYLKADAGQHDRRSGVMRLLSAWGSDSTMPAALSAVSDDTAYFSLAARQNGLSLLRIRQD